MNIGSGNKNIDAFSNGLIKFVDEYVKPGMSITIAYSVSDDNNAEGCQTTFASYSHGCDCTRRDFSKEVGNFVLELEALDKTFDHN